jgi:hypothetical protein
MKIEDSLAYVSQIKQLTGPINIFRPIMEINTVNIGLLIRFYFFDTAPIVKIELKLVQGVSRGSTHTEPIR